jgi:hypothetical protein
MIGVILLFIITGCKGTKNNAITHHFFQKKTNNYHS